MTSTERSSILIVVVLLATMTLMTAVGTVICAIDRPPAGTQHEITDRYTLPPELAGVRVFELRPDGRLAGPTLFVVARGSEPLAASWHEQGKDQQLRSVLVEGK